MPRGTLREGEKASTLTWGANCGEETSLKRNVWKAEMKKWSLSRMYLKGWNEEVKSIKKVSERLKWRSEVSQESIWKAEMKKSSLSRIYLKVWNDEVKSLKKVSAKASKFKFSLPASIRPLIGDVIRRRFFSNFRINLLKYGAGWYGRKPQIPGACAIKMPLCERTEGKAKKATKNPPSWQEFGWCGGDWRRTQWSLTRHRKLNCSSIPRINYFLVHWVVPPKKISKSGHWSLKS